MRAIAEYRGGRFRVLGQAGENALRRIHNIFPARSLGRRAYLRTPRRCPSTGVWTFKARLTFADGGVERNVHRMPCRRKPERATRSRR